MWLNGPKWIADDEFEPQYSDTSIPEECLSEMKVKDLMAHSVLITQGCCQYEPVITCEHFSTLSHLLRVTAYFQKFISILKAKVKRTNIPSSVVTALDIESALLYWVKLSQKTLNQDEQFDAWQKQLGLYCDTDGVWRCKGRLGNADLQENTKYPIFLNRKHHLTALVVQDCHTRVMHNGVKETLTEFRSRYWIVRGSSTCEEDPEFGSGDIKADLTSHMRHVNHVLECFWRRWRSEYLAGLREYHAYGARVKPAKSKVAAGDVVLIYDADQPRTMWRMGRVESLLQSSDGNVRGASLPVSSGSKSTLLRRPIQQLYPLETSVPVSSDIQYPNQRPQLHTLLRWRRLILLKLYPIHAEQLLNLQDTDLRN
ncbi:hypothetical protein EMCRGX_G002133 [Ephydatia muelleri]